MQSVMQTSQEQQGESHCDVRAPELSTLPDPSGDSLRIYQFGHINLTTLDLPGGGSILSTDIEERSQTLYTAPCNGTLSHGAQIGGLCVLPPMHAKTRNNASTIFTCHGVFHTCLSSRSDCSRCRWHYAPDQSRLFWFRENIKNPQFEHARIKMAQVLGSPLYICDFM